MVIIKILKNIIIITGVIFLIWFVAPLAIYGILNAGNMLGTVASLLLTLYGIFFKKVNNFLYARKLLLVITSVFLALAVIFVIYASVKITGAFNNEPDKETTVVVLGCQVKPYGPSLMLTERLNAAYDYLCKNPELKCVLSGGQGADEPTSEALAMYQWLTDRGIDKNRLFLEDKSTSTEENIRFTKKVIEENNLAPEITIITNEFHQYRARELARKQGIKSFSVSAKTLITFFPTFFLREIGGVLFELIRS